MTYNVLSRWVSAESIQNYGSLLGLSTVKIVNGDIIKASLIISM